jgi:BlaI family transcriptional regulator, penicillinase repressor
MGRPAQDITESELAVLRILWDRETATIRQLTDVLYPQGEAAQYATVQKLLDRMEAKGYVRRDRTMFVHVFRSVLDRDELIGRRLRSLAEMLCDGSLTPLLTHLARASDLTDQDRMALRAIVDEPEPDANMLDVALAKKSVEMSVAELPHATRALPPGNGQGSTSHSH